MLSSHAPVSQSQQRLVTQSQDLRRVERLMENLDRELSLEVTILKEKATALKEESIKLARQRAFLREERKKAREDADNINYHRVQVQLMQRDDWFPYDCLPDLGLAAEKLERKKEREREKAELKAKNGDYTNRSDLTMSTTSTESTKEYIPRTIKFNVEGHGFEVCDATLRRDPDSLLATLADPNCPINVAGSKEEGGIIYFDRDWWLFRYVLIFLRDGLLPEDKTLLVQLYREATFWNCNALKRAIEETQLSLRRKDIVVDARGNLQETEYSAGWWNVVPHWLGGKGFGPCFAPPGSDNAMGKVTGTGNNANQGYQGGIGGGGNGGNWGASNMGGGMEGEPISSGPVYTPPPSETNKKKDTKKETKDEDDTFDWWIKSEYKGRNYGAISNHKLKVVTDPKSKDALKMLSCTWNRPMSSKKSSYSRTCSDDVRSSFTEGESHSSGGGDKSTSSSSNEPISDISPLIIAQATAKDSKD